MNRHPDSAVRVRNDLLQWIMGFSSLTRMGWIFVMARALKRLLLLTLGWSHLAKDTNAFLDP